MALLTSAFVIQAVEKAKEIEGGVTDPASATVVVETLDVHGLSKVHVSSKAIELSLYFPSPTQYLIYPLHIHSYLFLLYCIVFQALDMALKQLKGLPNTAVMLFSVDEDSQKLVCHCQVPPVSGGKD